MQVQRHGSSGIVGFNYNGTDYYYRKNILGDVLDIYTTGGTKVASYAYDAWGNHEITLNSNNIGAINPIRYRGYYYDTETGLYYLQTRYYDPETGRFISPDTYDTLTADMSELSDKNLYAYCGNNPVSRKDDEGEFWNFIIGGVVGGLVGGVVAAINSYNSNTGKVNLAKIAIGVVSGTTSGIVAASGLGIFAQAGISAAISGAADLANQGVDISQNDGDITDVNLIQTGQEAVLGGLTSIAGSALGNLNGYKIMKTKVKANAAYKSYLEKTFTAGLRKDAGRSSSALLRQANRYLSKSDFYENVTRGWSSVIGSLISFGNVLR